MFSDIKKQYAATPYNLEKIDDIDIETFQSTINPQLLLEMLLLESRSKTITFSSALKKNEIKIEKQQDSEIKHLENIDQESNFELLKAKKEELQSLREIKLRGTLIRLRAKWIYQGEKASKYF